MTDGADGGGERIIRRKLGDQVFDRLRDMIARGEVLAGDPLPSERALMDRFGVGRPAVREALQRMQAMGMITITHGGPTRVNALDAAGLLGRVDAVARLLLSAEPAQLGYLKDARRMFETGVVRRAAEQASAADVADLRALALRQRDRIGQPAAFVRADMAFHARIAAIGGNPIVTAVSEAMLGWLSEYHGTLLHWAGREAVTLAEHDAIVDLIAAQDADGAVAAMQAHLDRAADAYRHAAPQG